MVADLQEAAVGYATSSPTPSQRDGVLLAADKPSNLEFGLVCPICGIHFTRKSNCREHQKLHDPRFQKRFECNICGKSLRRNADLRRHENSVSVSLYLSGSHDLSGLKVHKGMKRFCCGRCGKQYSRSDTLARYDISYITAPSYIKI